MYYERNIAKTQTVEFYIPRPPKRVTSNDYGLKFEMDIQIHFLYVNALIIFMEKISFKYAIIDMKHGKPDQPPHIFTTNQQINNIQTNKQKAKKGLWAQSNWPNVPLH